MNPPRSTLISSRRGQCLHVEPADDLLRMSLESDLSSVRYSASRRTSYSPFRKRLCLRPISLYIYQAPSLNGNDSIGYARMVFEEQDWRNQILNQQQISNALKRSMSLFYSELFTNGEASSRLDHRFFFCSRWSGYDENSVEWSGIREFSIQERVDYYLFRLTDKGH